MLCFLGKVDVGEVVDEVGQGEAGVEAVVVRENLDS